MRDVPDYAAMQSGDMLKMLGDSGQKWAEAFIQIIDKIGRDKIDESFMMGWFANAIEHSNDVRRWRRMTPIREAVARGWFHEQNAGKEMDADLAEAIAIEVEATAKVAG